MLRVIFLVLSIFSAAALAAPGPLERDLKELEVRDPVPGNSLSDRIHTVQMRARPLSKKTEVLIGAGQILGGNGFLKTQNVSAEVQYHFNDRWSVAGAYSSLQNEFTASASRLQAATGLMPDVDYAKSRMEARAQVNLFYGKIRFTRRQAISFDQYFGLGLAQNELRSGSAGGPVADLGIAFWISKWGSLHLGVKDYYYKENRTLSQGNAHNVTAYAQAGMVF